MAYREIYYEEIRNITNKGMKKCQIWLEELDDIQKKIDAIKRTSNFKGQTADSIKNYLGEVHGVLIAIMTALAGAYQARAATYYSGYKISVDSGDEKNEKYTKIVSSEVENDGSIERKIKQIKYVAEQVAWNANEVRKSISDLVRIYASPNLDNLINELDNALSEAKKVHNNALAFESSRTSDFDEIDRLIAQAFSIINQQSGNSRMPISAYASGGIAFMCDIKNLNTDLEASKGIIEAFVHSDEYEELMQNAMNIDEIIQKEAEKDREWAKWISVGVAVVGSVVLIVATAGTGSVLVGAAWGAAIGGVTAATDAFVDQYVKEGSFENMNWSNFAREVTIGTVTGAITGAFSVVSTGSAIKQPIEKAALALGKTAAEKGAEGLINTGWDIGEAIHDKKPGDKIWSIIKDDVLETAQDIVVEGGKEFVGNLVGGHFGVDTSDKGFLQQLGEKSAEHLAGNITEKGLNTVWEIGECYLDPDSSKNAISVLKENAKEFISDFGKDVVSDALSLGFSDKIDDIDNKIKKVAAETFQDTLAGTAGTVAKGILGREMDYLYGDEKDKGKIWDWEEIKEDLDDGREVAKTFGKSLVKNTADEAMKRQKYQANLLRKDYDGDGKLEVVQFGDYSILKEDYDAAVDVAGKGAYKDQTVQDILGLPKDTDLSSGKERTVRIDMMEKYSSSRKTTDTVTIDGKYTFDKNYYESAVNAAGKGEYKGKKVQDILGIPEDVKLSEEKITYKRYRNSDIGRGKEVQLHREDTSNVGKIHISPNTPEAKKRREVEQKKAEEAKKKEESINNKK